MLSRANKLQITGEQMRDVIDYLHHVRETKPKRLHRTISLVHELKTLNKAFTWTGFNCIVLDFGTVRIYIHADVTHYLVRYQRGENFAIRELDQANGKQLLFELVAIEWLDDSFIPDSNQLKLNLL